MTDFLIIRHLDRMNDFGAITSVPSRLVERTYYYTLTNFRALHRSLHLSLHPPAHLAPNEVFLHHVSNQSPIVKTRGSIGSGARHDVSHSLLRAQSDLLGRTTLSHIEKPHRKVPSFRRREPELLPSADSARFRSRDSQRSPVVRARLHVATPQRTDHSKETS